MAIGANPGAETIGTDDDGPALQTWGSQKMNDEQPKPHCISDAELEREIRKERKFSLEEAIMRMAGPGMMKGESPVNLKKQAEAKIDGFLGCHLIDAASALSLVLLRHVTNSELLLQNLDQPLVVSAYFLCISERLADSFKRNKPVGDYRQTYPQKWGISVLVKARVAA